MSRIKKEIEYLTEFQIDDLLRKGVAPALDDGLSTGLVETRLLKLHQKLMLLMNRQRTVFHRTPP